MITLGVEYSETGEYRGSIISGDEDEKWPSYEDGDADFQLKRVIQIKEKDRDNLHYYCELFSLDLEEVPDHVYVVYAKYSTGDTFGRCNNCGKVLEVCLNFEEAKGKIKEYENKDSNDYSVPWNGYFECLDFIDAQLMHVYK